MYSIHKRTKIREPTYTQNISRCILTQMNALFTLIINSLQNLFTSPRLLLLHILAILLTIITVTTDTDWHYFVYMQQTSLIKYIFIPSIFLGAIVPLIFPLGTLIYSLSLSKTARKELIHTVITPFISASFLGWLISSAYKAFTGRVQPSLHDLTHNVSHSFYFGFMKHGIFWGWPSSHTTVAFAGSVAMLFLIKKPFLRALLLIYAFYIGIGISFSIHWLSEFIAGALIGTSIGIAVAKSVPKLATSI